jgi:AmmeMemoRadiSam system protein B
MQLRSVERTMSNTRSPAVAGLFYPGDAETLRREVDQLIADAEDGRGPTPKALIAPHAGYVYSGAVAATAYARIREPAAIRRVVLLGPAHRWPLRGIAYCGADAFTTPLGEVPVDMDALAMISTLPGVHQLDAAFDGEHCLEVQLPFLQARLRDFRIMPLLVGEADATEVAAVLERLWGGPETLIVISSDLSHYLDYDSASGLDARTAAAICALDAGSIASAQACGQRPIAGLLRAARAHGLEGRLLDLRNSGDTAGPRDRVVGYGAFAFS